jgi:hypothetical protein
MSIFEGAKVKTAYSNKFKKPFLDMEIINIWRFWTMMTLLKSRKRKVVSN